MPACYFFATRSNTSSRLTSASVCPAGLRVGFSAHFTGAVKPAERPFIGTSVDRCGADGARCPPPVSRRFHSQPDRIFCQPSCPFCQPARNFCQPSAEFHQADRIFNRPLRYSKSSAPPAGGGQRHGRNRNRTPPHPTRRYKKGSHPRRRVTSPSRVAAFQVHRCVCFAGLYCPQRRISSSSSRWRAVKVAGSLTLYVRMRSPYVPSPRS